MRPHGRQRARVVALAAVLLIQVWGCLIEPNRLVVRQYSLGTDNWPGALHGLRIALLSDVHTDHNFNGPDAVTRAVDAINAQRPDLVLMLGDYTKGGESDGEGVPPEQTAALLGRLAAPLGVFSVLGNHDWWFNGERVRHALAAHGIRVLENQIAGVRRHGTSLWLAGVADSWTGTPLVSHTLARVPRGQPVIVMSHSPEVFPDVPDSVPLAVAGHTHGGQIALPFLGSPFAGSPLSRQYRHGVVTNGGRALVVTSGLGTSLVPIRIGVPPEVVIVILEADTM